MTHSKQPVYSRIHLLIVLIVITFSYVGCTRTIASSPDLSPDKEVEDNGNATQSETNFGSIAIVDITIKHPTARLVYREENVRDRITRSIQESKGFKVIDWGRLEDVLFRRNLETSDLVTNPTLRKEVGELLLNDFFLQATITSFGERMDFSSTAFSKQKKQVVDVQLELFVKDALSNEIIASANGHGMIKRTITQTLGFGAAGGSDTVAADKALSLAVNDAVTSLLITMGTVPKRKKRLASPLQENGDEMIHRQPSVKVLFLLSETEKIDDNSQTGQHGDADNFSISSAEYAMAKVFSDSNYQVLTGDDVLGKAYSLRGDGDILASGWLTMEDIKEFEDLLQARSGLTSYAIRVGEVAKADIVISGTVKYELGEQSGPGNILGKTNNLIVLAKAILVKSKKTYHVSIVEKSYMAVLNKSLLKARETALVTAAREAAEDILRHTPLIKQASR